MNRLLLAFLLLATVIFVACRDRKSSTVSALSLQTDAEGLPGQDPAADTTALPLPSDGHEKKQEPSPLTPAGQQPSLQPDWEKKIIRTATLTAEVKDYQVFSRLVRERVQQAGGYIAREEQSQSGYKMENTWTIKIPVAQFSNVLTQLETGTAVVTEKTIQAEDVTSQYVDARARLETKRLVRQRYLELLKQARNMSEVLEVQREINAIQEEIESVTARINYLTQSSAMSTLTLTFFQVIDPDAYYGAEPAFFQRLREAFISGWKGLKEMLVGLVSLWPLLLGITGGIAAIRWYGRNRGRSRS
ncbi:MAG TPA: DUF4349 domain-containing protein [Lacibacter sp.]|nr:DUF4349 domain-containing protein [Lacibacter sp.]HMO90375.1 DUF4349 domain-containing protein [Lacibacter sp.]